MSDVFSKDKRSEIMSKIKSKDTKVEIAVRSYLFKQGFRFRKNDKRYPGKPDVVLPKYKTAILINGCFWHGHGNCKYYKPPKSNIDYWRRKIQKNRERDIVNRKKLEALGFKVIVLWECQVKDNFEKTMENLIKSIKN